MNIFYKYKSLEILKVSFSSLNFLNARLMFCNNLNRNCFETVVFKHFCFRDTHKIYVVLKLSKVCQECSYFSQVKSVTFTKIMEKNNGEKILNDIVI